MNWNIRHTSKYLIWALICYKCEPWYLLQTQWPGSTWIRGEYFTEFAKIAFWKSLLVLMVLGRVSQVCLPRVILWIGIKLPNLETENFSQLEKLSGKLFLIGKHFPAEIRFPTGKGFPTGKRFPTSGKHFTAGKSFPTGKPFPTGKRLPTGKGFPARKQFPTEKCFPDILPGWETLTSLETLPRMEI